MALWPTNRHARPIWTFAADNDLARPAGVLVKQPVLGCLEPFRGYLAARFVDDPHIDATVLHRELLDAGFDRSYPTLVREIRRLELRPVCVNCQHRRGKDVTVVGRREYCDVEVRHESLSKRHAVIVRTDGLLMIRDLASTNGTKVNGQRVMWAALLPNDRLTLGRCKFKVYLGSDTAPSPSEMRRPARGAAPSPAKPGPAFAPGPPEPGFPPPTPIGVPIAALVGSTDADADLGDLDEFQIDDEDEAFVVDLE